MLGFTWKRFFITLGISVGIWVVTNLIQLFDVNYWPAGFSLLGSSCTVTGYPVAFCLASYEKEKIVLIDLINIFFWFWVVYLIGKWFNKRSMG